MANYDNWKQTEPDPDRWDRPADDPRDAPVSADEQIHRLQQQAINCLEGLLSKGNRASQKADVQAIARMLEVIEVRAARHANQLHERYDQFVRAEDHDVNGSPF